MVIRKLALFCALCIFISACSPLFGPRPSEAQTSLPILTPTPIPTAPPLSIPTPSDPSWAANRLAGMSLPEKVGQMLLMGIEGRDLTDSNCQLLQRLRPGGIFIQAENAANPQQLRQLTRDIQRCAQTAAGEGSDQAKP